MRVSWLTPLIILNLFSLFAHEQNEFVLVTSLYNEVRPERQIEYLQSLSHLLENPFIKKIHVFYDLSKDKIEKSEILSFLLANSIDVTYIHKRPTFSQIFDFVNTHHAGEDIIICNGDIYFDDTLGLLNGFDLTNKFIALSKWDVLPDGSLESHPWHDAMGPSFGSHDVWIFRSPIINFDKPGTELGTAYCDAYLTYYAYMAKYDVFNPCLSIIAHHLHVSGIRNWKLEPVKDYILMVPWCTLDNVIYSTDNEIRKWF